MDGRQELLDLTVLAEASPRRILATYEILLAELRRRYVVRTNDAPVGQYAEWLALRVLGGKLESNSAKSYDLTTTDLKRIQIKARVVRKPAKPGERQLSTFRSFDFDGALVLLFDDTYHVRRATILTPDVVIANSRESSHVNGRIFIARDALLDLGADLTDQFVDAEDTLV